VKITEIETIPLSVPVSPARVLASARDSHAVSPFLLVRIRTDEGLVGTGEVSCTPRWSGEDAAIAQRVITRYFAPLLTGEDPRAVQRLTLRLDGEIVGHYFAKAGIEMALWDILGKSLDAPLHVLLGGAVRDRVRTKFSISGTDPAGAAELGGWAVEQGFTAMKVKVARGSVADDIERIAAVRAAIGDDVRLGVDANCGWTRDAARAALPRFVDHGIAFLEQPVGLRDLAGMAELRVGSTIPVVADDPIGTSTDALDAVRAEAADVLSVYVGMAGGVAAAQRVAAVATAAGIGWTIGSNLELGVALAAQMHLAVATPGLADETVPCDLLSPFYYDELLLAEPLPLEAGWAYPPVGPGLGVELDDEQVDRYRADR